MASATATVTVNTYPKGLTSDQRFLHVFGTIAISASPATYTTGGLALNFNPLSNGENGFIQLDVPNTTPVQVYIDSVGGGLFEYGWNKANNTIQIFAASAGAAGSAPFAELGNGVAIPAGVSGDTIAFEAVFVR